jgi:hypothetical protein
VINKRLASGLVTLSGESSNFLAEDLETISDTAAYLISIGVNTNPQNGANV